MLENYIPATSTLNVIYNDVATMLYNGITTCRYVHPTNSPISGNVNNEGKQGQFLGSSMYSNGDTFLVSNKHVQLAKLEKSVQSAGHLNFSSLVYVYSKTLND